MDSDAFREIPVWSQTLALLSKAGRYPQRAPDPGPRLDSDVWPGHGLWVEMNAPRSSVRSQPLHVGSRTIHLREMQGADLPGLREGLAPGAGIRGQGQ